MTLGIHFAFQVALKIHLSPNNCNEGRMSREFTDYYELLELSPNANLETIERVFRYFATKWHPDAGGDKTKFSQLIEAFETLRDPASRAAYDALFEQQQQQNADLIDDACKAGSDTVDRHKMLCLFYARRRQDAKRPALAVNTVARMLNCPLEVLDFHVWYFKEKGWINREENGGYSITADGVDRIESEEVGLANRKLIALQRTKDNNAIEMAQTHASNSA